MVKEKIFVWLESTSAVYKKTELYAKLKTAIDNVDQVVAKYLRESAGVFYKTGLYKPTVLQDKLLKVAINSALIRLQRDRCEQRVQQYLQEGKPKKTTQGQERAAKASKVTDEQIGPDPCGQAIELQAYHELAKSRFVESLCVNLQGNTFDGLWELVFSLINQQLPMTQPNGKFVHPPSLRPRVPIMFPLTSSHCNGRTITAVDARSRARQPSSAAKRENETLNTALGYLARLQKFKN